MKYLLFFLLFFNCTITNPSEQAQITIEEVKGTSWTRIEELNIKQNVYMHFRFGIGDTLYLTKIYYNPNPKTKLDSVPWIRYIKGPMLNIHYENDPTYNTPNIVFTWARKEYTDSLYQCPIVGYSIVDDWFLWDINDNGELLMGYVDLDRNCYYWEFIKQ